MTPGNRCIVSVGTGGYVAGIDRLHAHCAGENLLAYRDLMPEGCPTHSDVPYAFKFWAIEEALRRGHNVILWADSSIVPIRPLEPLWRHIETHGYWIADNGWNTGQWCCDAALIPLRITREESFKIPHPIAGAFGLDFRHEVSRKFFEQWFALAKDGRAFRGPWRNDDHKASRDPRVLGHRHDQTAMGVVAHRLGMTLTDPQPWIAYYGTENDQTVLCIRGIGQ